VHQERFYTRHQVYDRNNIFNQILIKALKLIPIISSSPFLKDRVYGLLFSFPELDEINVNEATFSNGQIKIKAKNKKTNQLENITLIPFGKTILRQVSF
jgi:5-methylcytosine-specific restriction enzyme subunit McrC